MKAQLRLKLLACLAASALIAQAQPLPSNPVAGPGRTDGRPPSPVMAGVSLDWSTRRRLVIGSDNWQLAWADDDSLNTVRGTFQLRDHPQHGPTGRTGAPMDRGTALGLPDRCPVVRPELVRATRRVRPSEPLIRPVQFRVGQGGSQRFRSLHDSGRDEETLRGRRLSQD